ncbi:hypothetical protein ES319_A02G147000v1 [Gossypium barbadense]|uniref:Uncharacterized protein n=1 Tax=Gossypium barbadense TaxID=3634 RepID=A0A5J5WQ76_GOSBA|nr:hypothetical protein ES319_A02G147000v1 [Gossypium barbadense]
MKKCDREYREMLRMSPVSRWSLNYRLKDLIDIVIQTNVVTKFALECGKDTMDELSLTTYFNEKKKEKHNWGHGRI